MPWFCVVYLAVMNDDERVSSHEQDGRGQGKHAEWQNAASRRNEVGGPTPFVLLHRHALLSASAPLRLRWHVGTGAHEAQGHSRDALHVNVVRSDCCCALMQQGDFEKERCPH